MKAKLIKTGNDYLLRDMNGEVLAITNGTTEGKSLSKQNCDEIFGIFDVEKLAIEYDLYEKINFVGQTRAYKAGFNKAMELNKDKVFTLEDIKKAINYMFEQTVVFGNKVSALDVDRFIQSLQQPIEIEVEIEMECCGNYSPPCNINCEYGPKPKLDSSGYLILKKI